MTASFSSSSYVPDNLVDGDTDDLLSRTVTLISGQNLSRGALLGKITASGKYTLSLSAATDGSEVPDAILAEDCDASAADAEALVYFAGRFIAAALTYGTAHTAATVRDGLQDRRGILLVGSVPA